MLHVALDCSCGHDAILSKNAKQLAAAANLVAAVSSVGLQTKPLWLSSALVTVFRLESSQARQLAEEIGDLCATTSRSLSQCEPRLRM